jgi:hypothetical protein
VPTALSNMRWFVNSERCDVVLDAQRRSLLATSLITNRTSARIGVLLPPAPHTGSYLDPSL